MDAFFAPDKIRGKPNITTIVDISRIEDIVAFHYADPAINVITTISYHQSVEDITTVFFDMETIEDIFHIEESSIGQIDIPCSSTDISGIINIILSFLYAMSNRCGLI